MFTHEIDFNIQCEDEHLVVKGVRGLLRTEMLSVMGLSSVINSSGNHLETAHNLVTASSRNSCIWLNVSDIKG